MKNKQDKASGEHSMRVLLRERNFLLFQNSGTLSINLDTSNQPVKGLLKTSV
jgi:hypothetical protein